MIIESIIDDVDDGRRVERDLEDVVGLMIHRTGVDHQTGVVLGYDAPSICDAFSGRAPEWAEVAKATGGENPYTFLIGGDLGPVGDDGRVWQALALDELGPHARRWASPRYIGIACIGDFRARYKRPPSSSQRASLITLTAALALDLGLTVGQIVGHGEIPSAHDGSKATGRPAACPGDLLDMADLRAVVADEMVLVGRISARERLLAAGLVYPSQC